MFLAPPLAEMALKFGPPEYFCLMLLGLIILTFLAGGSMPKALIMAAFGLVPGSDRDGHHDRHSPLYLWLLFFE